MMFVNDNRNPYNIFLEMLPQTKTVLLKNKYSAGYLWVLVGWGHISFYDEHNNISAETEL